MNPTNLYDYYTGQGKSLPSVNARKSLAAEAGISGNYTGTAEQNVQLLSYLNKKGAGGTSAAEVTPSPTYVPPSTVVNNTTPTTVLDLTSNVSGLQKQQEAYLAKKQAQYDKDQIAKEAAQKEADKAMADKTTYQEGRSTSSEILAEQNKKYQIDPQYEQITAMLPEITALRDQLNKLNEDEATAVENLSGQGRGIPMGVLGAQEAKIVRTYAIRENAVSAQLSAKSATMENLRGNITLANQLVTQAVNSYVYDTEQKVQDYKDLYTYNKDIIANLDKEQKDILDEQYKAVTDELATKRDEQLKVAQLALDNGLEYVPGDSIDTITRKIAIAGGSIQYKQAQSEILKNKSASVSSFATTYTPDLLAGFQKFPDASAEEIVGTIIGTLTNQGITVSNENVTALLELAKSLKGKMPAPTPAGTEAGYTGETKKEAVKNASGETMYFKDVPVKTNPNLLNIDFSKMGTGRNLLEEAGIDAVYNDLFNAS